MYGIIFKIRAVKQLFFYFNQTVTDLVTLIL